MSGLDEWSGHLKLDFIECISNEWRAYNHDDLSLRECFRFVKYKMNVVREMHLLANEDARREFCVALYEFTHRIVALSARDAAFIAQYEGRAPGSAAAGIPDSNPH